MGFGIVAGAAVMAVSLHSSAERDDAFFLRFLGLIAWGISAYYGKLIVDARRLDARRLAAGQLPPALQIYCDPRQRKHLLCTLAWIIIPSVAKVILLLNGDFP